MKARIATIDYRRSIDDDGVLTYPINLQQAISEFGIWFYATNHGTGPNADSPINHCVEKVELVDGSDVLWSLSGPQATALYAFDHLQMPFQWNSERGGASQYHNIPIWFGRHIEDPNYIFDPTQFTNPQLRIHWDLAAINGLGANGFESGTGQLSIWAYTLPEGAEPVGYFRPTEIKSFTPAASGEERSDIPTDLPIRKLIIRPYATDTAMNSMITNLKLSINQDAAIPFDLNSHDMIFLMHKLFPAFVRQSRKTAGDGDTRQYFHGEYVYGELTADAAANILAGGGWTDQHFDIHCVDDAGAAVTSQDMIMEVEGRCPEDSFCFPFGDQEDPDDWLSLRAADNLELILDQGSAGGTVELVTEQVRRY